MLDIKECRQLWEEISEEFPDWMEKISEQKKQENERFLEEKTEQWNLYWNHVPMKEKEKKRWKKTGRQWIKKLLEGTAIFGLENLNLQTKETFMTQMQYFLIETRKFDYNLCLQDIGQAMRNFCICILFSELKEEKPEFEKAAWAYSLLYPYTDNLIDSTAISEEEKKRFHDWLHKRLLGIKNKETVNIHQKVSDLFGQIENVYNRETYKELHQSILWIYEAQVESLKQQKKELILTPEQLLTISIQKGGASVLVDGYLINGELNQKEIEFYIEFGFLLQLADDLQDITTDLEQNHDTLYHNWIKEGKLDKKLNKILQFLNHIMKKAALQEKAIESVMLQNSIYLLIISALQSSDYFSGTYLKQLEQYLPISYSFLKNMQEKQKESVFAKEEETILMKKIDCFLEDYC